MVVLSTELPQLKKHSVLIPVLQSLRSPHKAISTIHRTYGDMVLGGFFNKKLLFICRPEHIEEIYSQEARGLLSRDFLYEAKKSLFGDGLINSKTEIWTNQRRLLQPLFTKEAIADWEKIITTIATTTINKLKNSPVLELNISKELRILVQSIFIQILLGKSVDDIPDKDRLMSAVGAISKGLLPQMILQIISDGKLLKLMHNKNRHYHAAVAQLYAFVNNEIANKHEYHGHDLISMMMQATDKKTGYSITAELLKDETVNLLFAGQDTTINTLSWFFYLIGRHPEVHKKITEEVLQYQDDTLSVVNLSKLVYTKAVLYETLRLYPPSPALATQTVANIAIGGHLVTKGTTIILSSYVTHRHAALWERPNEFYPEHFLNPQLATERHKYAFYPFGGGLHNCIGRHFAELEMMIIIVTLLREFSFKTDNTVKAAASMTLKPDRDVMLSITPLPTNVN